MLLMAGPAWAGMGDDLFSVSFADQRIGWACGRWGVVLHTRDGGHTWTPQASGTDATLSSIQFIDERHGWAAGARGTILRTVDGGKTWTLQKSPVPYFLMGLCFVDARQGWIVTEKTTILHTTDGGVTWQVQFSGQDYILKAVSFSDAQSGWAVGEYGYIFHTENGGRTWTKQAGSFAISDTTGEIEGGTFLFKVRAVDDRTAWAVGMDSHILATVDGGRTWNKFTPNGPGAQLFCLYADASGEVLAGGKGAFLASLDSGATWQRPSFSPPLTYGWVYGLAKRREGGFVAVGKEGAIYLQDADAWRRVDNRPAQAKRN